MAFLIHEYTIICRDHEGPERGMSVHSGLIDVYADESSVLLGIKYKIVEYSAVHGVTNIPEVILERVARDVLKKRTMQWAPKSCVCKKFIVISLPRDKDYIIPEDENFKAEYMVELMPELFITYGRNS